MVRKGRKRKASYFNKKLGCLLIVAGIILALYPLYTDFYARYEQAKLQASLRESMEGVALSQEKSQEKPSPLALYYKEQTVSSEFEKALLEIPAINLKVAVVQGTSQEKLKTAPGWYEKSELPGGGNTAIAGHRTMYGGWFRYINSLKNGDSVNLSWGGNTYLYEVEKVYPIKKNDWSVIDPCGYPAITLTTCYTENQRLAVRGKLEKVISDSAGEII